MISNKPDIQQTQKPSNMSSDKRDMKNFDKFDGEVDDQGWYVFPHLFHRDTRGNTRVWRFFIRLIKSAEVGDVTGIDWNVLTQTTIPIKRKYFNYKFCFK